MGRLRLIKFITFLGIILFFTVKLDAKAAIHTEEMNLNQMSTNTSAMRNDSSDIIHVIKNNPNGDELENPDDFYEKYITESRKFISYFEYEKNYINIPRSNEIIELLGTSYQDTLFHQVEKKANYEGKENVVLINHDETLITYEFDVAKEGFYNIKIDYMPLPSKRMDIELSILIDETLPFSEATNIQLSRLWQDETKIKSDLNGNEFSPNQIEVFKWQELLLRDSEGIYNNEPFRFYLSEGIHKISLFNVREQYAISKITLFEAENIPSYQEMLSLYESNHYKEYKSDAIEIQGEEAYLKSDQTLIPLFDSSSPYTQPYSVSKIKMNVIGQLQWQKPGQWISWKIDVEKDGLYELAFRARQGFRRGLTSTRTLYIDGEIPFEEAKFIEFKYSNGWKMKSFEDEKGNPYLVYLSKGEHEIKLEVNIGELARSARNIADVVFNLNEIYRKIIMITSTTPDIYRDYNLENDIPDLIEQLQLNLDILEEEYDYIISVVDTKGSEAIIIERLIVQLESFIKKPYSIPSRIEDFKTNISALSAWSRELMDQPLEIDYFGLYAPDTKLPKAEVGFFGKIWYEIRLLWASFFENYNELGSTSSSKENETIVLWVNWGRDQAQVLQNLIDNDFTPNKNINVKVKLVNATLVQGILSGQSPDVSVMVARGQPVNLAMRDALYDISQFDDYDEVINERYNVGATIPYEYDGGTYGLPDTIQFYMMFYRKDIFKELGIDPPQTWEELYQIASVLQRNNMQIGIPYTTVTQYNLIDQGMGTTNIFPTLLYQNNGQMYNDEKSQVSLLEQEAIEAFEQWTKLYIDYGFPLQYDFYNRFRTGEMPIGIAPYTEFNRFSVAAPEIKNLWEMIPIPGTVDEDGFIHRETASSGTAAVILKNSQHKEASWEFLKWWTSSKTQTDFARNMEILMGTAARHSTANKVSFENLPWTERERENLTTQLQYVIHIPEIPGGYYTSRGIDNAFRSTVVDNENYRENLYKWVKEIDKEIERKRREFNLD